MIHRTVNTQFPVYSHLWALTNHLRHLVESNLTFRRSDSNVKSAASYAGMDVTV
jgi:hypothetical protein